MTDDDLTRLRDEVAGVLVQHRLEVEPRSYPSYACECEEWDGAIGDDGGPADGMNDNLLGHAEHVAQALLPLLARKIAEARGEAWDEGWAEGYDDARAGYQTRNPYRAALAEPTGSEGE